VDCERVAVCSGKERADSRKMVFYPVFGDVCALSRSVEGRVAYGESEVWLGCKTKTLGTTATMTRRPLPMSLVGKVRR